MKASTEVITNASVEVNSVKASITSMKSSMEYFVEVTSIEAFVKALLDTPVEVAWVEELIYFIPSMEASTEASRKASREGFFRKSFPYLRENLHYFHESSRGRFRRIYFHGISRLSFRVSSRRSYFVGPFIPFIPSMKASTEVLRLLPWKLIPRKLQ